MWLGFPGNSNRQFKWGRVERYEFKKITPD